MNALAILQRLASGRLVEELAEALTVTAQEVVATGKPGTVTLTLKVSTKGQGNPLVVVEETIARAAPRRDPRGAIFYAIDGGLHRDDPRQPHLEFRTVDHATGEIRDSNGGDYAEREAL